MSKSTETTRRSTGAVGSPHTTRLSLNDLLTSGAQAWGLSRLSILAILLAPVVVAASGVVAALAGKSVYVAYADEDGIAETLQVLLYGAAWVLCLLVARDHARIGNRLIAVLYVVLLAGLFFLIGEEISWGQRIFGWGTPASFAAINKQEETNLHNIHGVGATFKWIQMLVGAYGTILPLVFLRPDRMARFRTLIDAVVPHYTLIPCFLPMFVWKLYRNLAGDPSRYYFVIIHYNEVIELILALGFCLFLVFQWRKNRRAYAAPATAR